MTKEAIVGVRKSFIAGALAALLALGGVACEPAQDGGTETPTEEGAES